MTAILLILVIFGITVQHVTKKIYTGKAQGGAYTFCAVGALVALIFFIIMSGGSFRFHLAIIPYSIGFAATYTLSLVFTFLAIKEGPLSITTLITSYSLLIPTVYGWVAWQEPFSLLLLFGILLLLISIFLIRFEKHLEKKREEKRISGKWLLYVILAFLGSGGCSTVQKAQQLSFRGAYKNEFMIIALFITFLAVFFCALMMERKTLLKNLRCGFLMATIGGVANGTVNFMVMILSLRMPASIMFPIMSGGIILSTTSLSVTVYKERLSFVQKIGIALGIIAIFAINV